jgi:hypothetical protein
MDGGTTTSTAFFGAPIEQVVRGRAISAPEGLLPVVLRWWCKPGIRESRG